MYPFLFLLLVSCTEACMICRFSICMQGGSTGTVISVPFVCRQAPTIIRLSICLQGGPKGTAMSSSQQTLQWRGLAASVGPCCWTGRSTSTQLPMAAAPSPLSPASQWRAAGSASATLLQTQTSLSALVSRFSLVQQALHVRLQARHARLQALVISA